MKELAFIAFGFILGSLTEGMPRIAVLGIPVAFLVGWLLW